MLLVHLLLSALLPALSFTRRRRGNASARSGLSRRILRRMRQRRACRRRRCGHCARRVAVGLHAHRMLVGPLPLGLLAGRGSA